MIKITFDSDRELCECSHLRQDHSSSGCFCFRTTHRKERRRNPNTNKYEVYQTHYCCACKGFKKMEDKV